MNDDTSEASLRKKVKTPLTHEYTEENEYFIEVRKCILTKGNTVGLKGEVFAHSLGDTLL